MRAASMVSTGTPLIAADSSTIEKPICPHRKMMISSKVLTWKFCCCSHAMGLPPSFVHTAFWMPTWVWLAGSVA